MLDPDPQPNPIQVLNFDLCWTNFGSIFKYCSAEIQKSIELWSMHVLEHLHKHYNLLIEFKKDTAYT